MPHLKITITLRWIYCASRLLLKSMFSFSLVFRLVMRGKAGYPSVYQRLTMTYPILPPRGRGIFLNCENCAL